MKQEQFYPFKVAEGDVTHILVGADKPGYLELVAVEGGQTPIYMLKGRRSKEQFVTNLESDNPDFDAAAYKEAPGCQVIWEKGATTVTLFGWNQSIGYLRWVEC